MTSMAYIDKECKTTNNLANELGSFRQRHRLQIESQNHPAYLPLLIAAQTVSTAWTFFIHLKGIYFDKDCF